MIMTTLRIVEWSDFLDVYPVDIPNDKFGDL